MKIVVGMPVAERAWALPGWFNSVESQVFSTIPEVTVSVVCLYTHSHDATLEVLQAHHAEIIRSILPTRPYERIIGHNWSMRDHEYEYMASIRNTLRKEILLMDADYFFSLDSDILLPHTSALENLVLEAEGTYDAVSPLVNMVQIGDPAYSFMMFTADGARGERVPLRSKSEAFEADIIMAAMLLNRQAQRVPWASHLQGEDIGWSMNARALDLKVGVVPSIRCDHRMRVHG